MKKFLVVMLLVLFVFGFTINAAEFLSKTVIEDEISDTIILSAIDMEVFPEGRGTPPPPGGGP